MKRAFILCAAIVIVSFFGNTTAGALQTEQNDSLNSISQDTALPEINSSLTEEQTQDLYNTYYDAAGVEKIKDGIDDTVLSDVEKLGLDPSKGSFKPPTLQGIADIIFDRLKEAFKAPFVALCCVTCALMICSSMGIFCKTELLDAGDYMAALCISAIAVVPFCAAVSSAVKAILLCCTLIISFLPVYCGILLCMGSSAFSASLNSLIFGLAQVVSNLAGTIITPFSGMYLALSVCSTFSPEMRLGGLTSAIKKAVFWTLGISMTVFSAVLGITGAVNSAADGVSMKTARFFLSNSIPIAGAALTDSIAAVAGSISLLKTGVGAFGICALIFTLLPTLLQMLMWKAGLSIMSVTAELFGRNRCCLLLKGLGDGAGLILSVTVSIGVLFLICLVILSVGSRNLFAG